MSFFENVGTKEETHSALELAVKQEVETQVAKLKSELFTQLDIMRCELDFLNQYTRDIVHQQATDSADEIVLIKSKIESIRYQLEHLDAEVRCGHIIY